VLRGKRKEKKRKEKRRGEREREKREVGSGETSVQLFGKESISFFHKRKTINEKTNQ
jgi:hypothetical protein